MCILTSIVILSVVLGNEVIANTCDWESCFEEYDEAKSNPNPSEICPIIEETWRCVYQLECGLDLGLSVTKADLEEKTNDYNCTKPEMPTTSPPPVSNISCPSKLSRLPLFPINNFSIPDFELKSSGQLCSSYVGNKCGNSYATRHCSVYTYSHILPFNENSIQSFTLPGSYYIFSHDKGVKIQIFTAVNDVQSPNSLSIQKIKVTVQSTDCTLGATFNYTATTTEELPDVYVTDDDSDIIRALYNPVQLNVNSDRTVATILVAWLNLTVVIRRLNSNLGIVIQVPAELSAESEGLCSTGVPIHSRYSPSEVAAQTCNSSDHLLALTACTQHANLIAIDPATAASYSYTCIYDILQSLSYELLTLYLAFWSDLQVLPSEGLCIIPNPLDPPVEQIDILPSSTSTTTTTTDSSTISTTANTVTTDADPTLNIVDKIQESYSAADSSLRPSMLFVLSLCLCLLVTIILS